MQHSPNEAVQTVEGWYLIPQPYPLWAACLDLDPSVQLRPENADYWAALTDAEILGNPDQFTSSGIHLVAFWEYRPGYIPNARWDPVTADVGSDECADVFGVSEAAIRQEIVNRVWALRDQVRRLINEGRAAA